MVTRFARCLLALCVTALVVAAAPSRVAAYQTAAVLAPPDIQVGVRPDRVRVGSSFTVTVRIVAEGWPEAVELEGGAAAEFVDVVDRSSSQVGADGSVRNVFERSFEFRARAPGVVTLPPVLVDFGGQIHERPVPSVQSSPQGLDWGTPGGSPRSDRNAEVQPVPEGVAPTGRGRDYDATRGAPGGWPGSPQDPTWNSFGVPPGTPGATPGVPYGRGLGQYPSGGYPGYGATGGYSPAGSGGYGVYGGFGGLPPGEGWAATAPNDPWWPEIVPELGFYPSTVQDPDGLAQLQTGLSPERVYVGQQATLVATATFPPEARYRMSRDPEFFPAGASDAWVVDVPWAAPAPSAVGGRLEEAHSFLRAYFPLSPGRLTVEPARLSYSAGAEGVGRPPLDTLVSDALSVEVMPIPEADAPPTWAGAVGRYRINAWVTPARVGWGESALLMVEIAGVGHLPSQPRPDPGPIWGGGLRPMGERAWIEIRDGVVGGVKRFTWLVVPTEPGAIRIGPIFYSFFDPYVGAFGQVLSEELVLQADPHGAPGGGTLDPGLPADMQRPVDPWSSAPYSDPAAGPHMSGSELVPPPGSPEDGVVSAGAAGSAGYARGGGPVVGTSMPPVTPATPVTPGPEARTQVLVDAVQDDPDNADVWLALGESLAESRPGEGWDTWAWRSGLRASPRDEALQRAVWGEPTWRADIGLPMLPLRNREATLAAGLLGALTLAFGMAGALMGFRQGWSGEARAFLAAMIVLGASTAVVGTSLRASDAGTGVVVGGGTALRADPTGIGEAIGSLPPGQAVRSIDRYGDWLLVEDAAGRRGWVEDVRVAPLQETARARS